MRPAMMSRCASGHIIQLREGLLSNKERLAARYHCNNSYLRVEGTTGVFATLRVVCQSPLLQNQVPLRCHGRGRGIDSATEHEQNVNHKTVGGSCVQKNCAILGVHPITVSPTSVQFKSEINGVFPC